MRWAVRGGLVLLCTVAGTHLAFAQDAATLRARRAALAAHLSNNQFQRPLYLESSATPDRLKGDVYALLDQPFAVAGPALLRMNNWCDILILHQNVKSCRPARSTSGDGLSLRIGRKYDQPLADAYPFEFGYRVMANRPDYLQVALVADEGPMDTSAYRIVLEVVALDAGHSFLHLSYTYAYGPIARVAMRGYLATTGRRKVGFSVVGHSADGQPVYIGSTRGVVERNTMRYYLAIEAYLDALSVPAPKQFESRLNDWYAGVERYPVQLHELERDEYLAMKRREVRRDAAP